MFPQGPSTSSAKENVSPAPKSLKDTVKDLEPSTMPVAPLNPVAAEPLRAVNGRGSRAPGDANVGSRNRGAARSKVTLCSFKFAGPLLKAIEKSPNIPPVKVAVLSTGAASATHVLNKDAMKRPGIVFFVIDRVSILPWYAQERDCP